MAVAPTAEVLAVALTVNGEPVTVQIDPDLTLLDLLRDHLDIISPKDGCQPQASCGCCTLMIDGKPRLSCTMKAASVGGKELLTLEGLPEQTRKNLADSFRTVRKNTLAIAEEIPEDKYGFKATPEVMSVGEMLAHLALSPMWQIDVQHPYWAPDYGTPT